MRLFLLLGVLASACASSYVPTDPSAESGSALAADRATPAAHAGLCSQLARARPAPARTTAQPWYRWSHRFGGEAGDEAAAVALDPAGNIVIAGQFSGSVDLGPETIESRGAGDGFVIKLSPAGELLWARTLGGAGADFAGEVAVDTAGTIIVAGGFENTMAFAGNSLRARGMSDVFVAAYSSDGAELWARSFGGPSWELPAALALDMSGDILMAGTFVHSMVMQPPTMAMDGRVLESAGEADAFVVRLAPDGTHIWSTRLGEQGWDEANAVAVDADDNAIMAGDISGQHGSLGFVAMYSAEGKRLWEKSFTGTANARPLAVAASPEGGIWLAGTFAGTVNLGGEAMDSAGKHDIFLASYAHDGRHLWSRRFGGAQGDCARAISLHPDPARGFVVSGAISGDVNLGGDTLHAGHLDMFVAGFTATGEHLWSHRFAGAGAGSRSVAVTATGAVVVAGSFPHALDPGSGQALVSAGAFDAFVLMLQPGPGAIHPRPASAL